MSKEILWADNLRAFATFSVILLHVSASSLNQYGHISDNIWWVGNIYNSTVRFCVPIFLMLSGALIFSKTYELSNFFKKRFSRIIFPFIFWSLLYIFNDLLIQFLNGDNMYVNEVTSIVFLKLKNGASFHLWYIYMLIGLYLIFPIFQKWINNSSNKEIIYYLFIWLLVMILGLPIINKLKPDIDFRYFSGFIGYPILGYFLAVKLDYKKKLIPFLLFVSGVLITIYGTYIITKLKGQFYDGLYGFLSPNVIIASIGFFLLIKNSTIENNLINNAIRLVSRYSYGIYLSHIIVLFYLSKIGINWIFVNPIFGIPMTTFLCLILSLFLTLFLNKIPLGKYISG